MSSVQNYSDPLNSIVKPMDKRVFSPSQLHEEESGLGYLNTLVSYLKYV